ncbi:transferase family protein [Aspergillus undulatus]|uniref:transferase family protein n=1 Tax=Aspergillus undulatus TaxID=1810928 RepID=UPI003CCC9F80
MSHETALHAVNCPAQGSPIQNHQAIRQVSRLVLEILTEYALGKFDNAGDRLETIAANALPVIDRFVAAGMRIEACLPAFPFKSANKVYKVLGSLPDKAEELALGRLNAMCMRVREVYSPGAQVTIISDGITYNDLLCISDQDTWAYGEALRKMAIEKKFTCIAFSRIRDLLDLPLPEKLSEIVYVANCTEFRRLLLNKYGKPDLDIDWEISSNADTKLTYLGYKRFLESDLKYIFPRGRDRSSHSYKRDCKYLAKQMLTRGYAFAAAIKNAFPNHLRLSIHESMSGQKVSISLLDSETGFTTPWHCSVAQLANRRWISAPMGEFSKDGRMELVYTDGRPSYFREKSRDEDASGVSEITASYLRQAKAINAREYVERALTPSSSSLGVPSPGRPSVFSPSPSEDGSIGTTPDSQPRTSPALKGLGINPGGSLSSASLPEPASDPDSVPYGRRLIPQIMDSLAIADPGRIVFSLTTLLADNTLEFRHISARQFTKAVDKTTWWLHNQVGKPDSVQPVGYIGPHDLRHVLLTYACVKAGYAALFLSPKNNTQGALAVLEATRCNIWVNACDTQPVALVKEVLQKRPMSLLQLPPLDDLLDVESTKAFPYTKTFSDAANDPFCFLHTSGTTGVPKPIPWSHGLIGTMDAVRLLPPVDGDSGLLPWTNDWKPGDKIYSSFPMSHGAGIIMDILMPALFDLHCFLGPAGILPSIHLVEALAGNARIDIWSMVPSLVDELGETPEVLSKLRSSKFICASGGPVSPVSAGKVNEVIRVLNLTGTTEGLFIGNLVVPREDWFWFCFHPYSGFEFKEVEADTYEHWVRRTEHWPLFQGIFHTFPEKEEINFKDLYMRHPTKPNFWAFKGRSDDLVVLSNGYKISPLETEAFITTHPAIAGCLVFGTGKPQAGLLIELKDSSLPKTEELLDSIWETIKQANSMSRHKNQLLKDFVTFAQPDKPFFRTDKGTVKRPATLKLYADYIERFYSSRNDDSIDESIALIDVGSTKNIQHHVRRILATSVSDPQQLAPDADLFSLGLDSLGVFAAVKAIRVATGLGGCIGPRHVYANPTIAKLSSTIAVLAGEREKANAAVSSNEPVNDEVARMKRMIAQHQARTSFTLNAFDYVNPNHGMGLMLYIPLGEGITFQQAFANLQEGLNRTFDLIPALSGKMMHCSEQMIGYTTGDLCVTIPPLSKAASAHNRLVYKDLSRVLPSFQELREASFPPSAFKDSLALRDDPFPAFPAEIVVGQANFVSGGCILAVDLNHCCLDGLGAMVALKAWAENCRYLQGDESATCSWYDPESFNHSLPEIIHEQEGWSRPLNEIDPGTWGFLPFFPPDDETHSSPSPTPATTSDHPTTTKETGLPPRPIFPLHSTWPLPKAKRPLRTTLFTISPAKLSQLHEDVLASSPNSPNETKSSTSDIVQALFWRAAIRARHRVASEIRKQTFPPDELSILELPTDGRPYFSSLLPESYMGSMLIMSRCTMNLSTLLSPKTSLADVAQFLHHSASRITPRLVHDAFTILQSLPDHSRFSTANMGLEHMHAMISNMMLFPFDEIRFGEQLFGNGGVPESLRPQLERGNGRFRFLVVFPLKADGGVELVLGTHAEELKMLLADDEFMEYAVLSDTCC